MGNRSGETAVDEHHDRNRPARIAAHIGDVPSETFSHRHADDHELLWNVAGSMFVESEHSVWELLPGTAVWIPSGTPHRLCGRSAGRYGWAFIAADECPAMWARPHQIEAPVLTRALLQHLSCELEPHEREHAEAVVFDLLHRELSIPSGRIPIPTDDRCRLIARALLADPSCERSLVEWGEEIGAGARTLSRLWVADTGLTYAQWRTQLRVGIAVAALGSGTDVFEAARRAGYRSASAFAAAFRRQTGRTPQSYAARLVDLGDDGTRLERVG